MNYYNKYLKYKNKYLKLKKSLEGGSDQSINDDDALAIGIQNSIDSAEAHQKIIEDENLARALQNSFNEEKYNEEILESHTSFANIKNMNLVTVVGDGNCFYRCISYALEGTENFHSYYREIVYEELNENKKIYRDFINGDVDTYIERMRTDKEWADNIELQAFANKTGIQIILYNMTDNGNERIIFPESINNMGKIIYLIYTGNHYNYLEPKT